MKKAFLLVTILFVSVISTACINNFAVQELNNKAKTYLDSGDFDSAIGRLKSSIDLDSTIFESHYNLGIAYTQAEKYPEAVESFQKAIKLKPDFADTYYSLAVAQENYAKGVIDGSLKEKGKEQKASETSELQSAERKLTKEEKQKVVELLNSSIESYNAYIEKGAAIKDRKDVEDKIDYLKAQIIKYSPETIQ